MHLLKWIVLVIGISSLTLACGSGGGGSSVTVDAEQNIDMPVAPLTRDIRNYKIGDTITYAMTLKDNSSGNIATGDIVFQVTKEVENPYGIKCKEFSMAGILNWSGESFSRITRSLYHQDSQGNLYHCGKYNHKSVSYTFIDDSIDTPNGLATSLENPVSIGNVVSGIVYYDDGRWTNCTAEITGSETVTTLMGMYQSYKESESCSYSDGSSFVATSWLYPSIYYIKGTAVSNDGDEITIDMKSYNLVP